MSQVMIERLKAAIERSGKSAQRISLEATGAKDTIRQILAGRSKNPRIDTIELIAQALDVDPRWLTDPNISEPINPETPAVRFARTPARTAETAKTVPINGTAAGTHINGAPHLAEPIGHVPAPPGLATLRDVYALYVEGNSMEPQFAAGELIFVSPHKPARPGDAVIILTEATSTTPRSITLGTLKARTESGIEISKHSSKGTITIPHRQVLHLHKVLTTNELFGA